MIKVYKNRNSKQSFSKVLVWLEKHRIRYQIITQTHLKYQDLIHILSMSKGFDDFIISKEKIARVYSDEMKTDVMLAYLLRHQYILKSPIIFDDKNYSIGYNTESLKALFLEIK